MKKREEILRISKKIIAELILSQEIGVDKKKSTPNKL